MAKNPADRYPDAQAMRAALQALSRTPATQGAKATVILPLPLPPKQGAGEPAAPPSVVSASVAGQAAPAANVANAASSSAATAIGLSNWDPAELSRIERALASHVGPMARVMVREAARSHADTDSLTSAVSRHIAEDAKRQQFLDAARAGGSHVTPIPAPSPLSSRATPVPQPAGAAAGDPLTEAFKAQALAVVTRKMGPIARVMVKRAGDAAGGHKGPFVRLLLEAIPEADRRGLQGELDKLG
jgi:serine/threonine-protein kinase